MRPDVFNDLGPLVFFGCCIAGAGAYTHAFIITMSHAKLYLGFSLMLPEVRGRDPDLVYAEEQRQK